MPVHKVLKLFDHVFATYCPAESERDPRYAAAVGHRALLQVVGRVAGEEGIGHVGELALMPGDTRDGLVGIFPHRIPLGHVVAVEPAPAGDCRLRSTELPDGWR